MTTLGWLIMFISVASVTGLLIWCIYKVLTIPEETEHVHGFEKETPDAENRD